jgi:hypothetical protein
MAYVLTNLLVWPGLGSLLSGRKSGVIPMLMAFAGFVMTCIWAFWFLNRWFALHQLPLQPGPYLKIALFGIALFIFSWCWSLVSSISLLRSTTKIG